MSDQQEVVAVAPIVCDQPDHISRTLLDDYIKRAREGANLIIERNTIRALRNLVSNGELYKDKATDVYNAIADENGWDNIDSIQATFDVHVSYEGDHIFTATGVEADDEDSACETVLENLEISNVSISFDIEYDTDSECPSVSIWDDSFIRDSLTATADEVEN
jgi:hypothetical protein